MALEQIETRWPEGLVLRVVLRKALDFRNVLETVGIPRYAFTATGNEDESCDDIKLSEAEWVLGDDLDLTLREVLQWDALGCQILCEEPSAEDLQRWGDDLEGTWLVKNLPATLYDIQRWQPGIDGYLKSQDELRQEFFDEVMSWSEGLGLMCLKASSFESYLLDWAVEDDMVENPAKFRADKRFGIIDGYSGVSYGRGPMQYSIWGHGQGRLCASVLQRAGLKIEQLVGMTCVWNGLDEIERIGSVDLKAFQGIPGSKKRADRA